MSEIKIIKNSIENSIISNGQVVIGSIDNVDFGNSNIVSNSSGSMAIGYIDSTTVSNTGASISATGLGSFASGYAFVETGSSPSGGLEIKAYHNVIASSIGAHAEGCGTQATEIYAHAEGYDSIASGMAAHAEGYQTQAEEAYSHAEGYKTHAYEMASHAGGIGTIANQEAMTAIGKYNVSTNTENTLFVVGDGNIDTQQHIISSDAFRVNSLGSETGTNSVPSSVQAKVNGVSDVYLGCPIGTIVMWAGETAPEGWLLCDGTLLQCTVKIGQAPEEWEYDIVITRRPPHGGQTINWYFRFVDREYVNLGKVILDTYGITSGTSGESGGIYLPNFQQRFPLGALQGGAIGINNSEDRNGWSTTIGSGSNSSAGEAEHVLTEKEMPNHMHNLNNLDGGDSNIYQKYGEERTGYSRGIDLNSNTSSTYDNVSSIFMKGNNDISSIIQVMTSAGENQAHNNIPPFLAINFIIKYK